MKTPDFISDKFTIDELIRKSWNFRNSDDFARFFHFIARFNHYSRYNTMLVYLQNPEVDFFGSSSYWKKHFNRTIKRNARPYVILAPMSPVILAYDVLDTEGRERPRDFLDRMFGEKPFEVKGHINPRIFDGAMFIADTWGIPTVFKELSYFKGGHVTTVLAGSPEITLNRDASIEENFTTFLHEIAHILLGHTGHKRLFKQESEKKMNLPERTKLTISSEELEAETVKYLISTKLGLIPNSEKYIAGYIKNPDDLLSFSYETVIKIADKIENMFLKPLPDRRNAGQTSLFG